MALFSFMFIFVILRFFLLRATFALVDSIRPLESISDGRTLVSSDGTFQLGFFTPSSSKNRYLGIWYKNIPVQTVVWVANRCNPINDSSGTLTTDDKGNLVLLSKNKSVVWSMSSLKQAQKPLVQLLNNGNLVLRDEKDAHSEDYLWQSFDYPSDTFLSGMKIGWDLRRNLTRYLSAWKSIDDPCNGDFTYRVELDARLHTYPEVVIREGSAKFYRAGAWNGIGFTGSPELRPNPVFDYGFVHSDDEVYYTYNLKNKSLISIIVMNQTARLRQRLVWIETERIWSPYNSIPRDQCDSYGLCGANSNCIMTGNPVCQCLQGFKPKSQEKWNSMDWSEGCVRNSPLSCPDSNKDGFMKFSDLKLPDAEHSWVNKSMNLEECRAKCLSNCSCMAYTNSDIREKGSGCVMWFGDLLDIRQFHSGEEDLYIRMLASEIERNGIKSKNEAHEEELELPLFSLPTISTATNNFSDKNKLGEGGFGPVYRGMLKEGQEIAVKRLSKSSGQGVNEFKNEAWTLMKEGKTFELIEKCLRDSYNNMEEVLRCIHVGLLCVQQSPVDRPNMSSIVLMLSGESVLPEPKPPGYFMKTDKWEEDHSSSRKIKSSSICDMSITVFEAR
ncbi:S-locus glycoprotein [Trema orientale]|uniref:non-specific serine/threonine protein kinase n=1 Tax=Trema orientale TaxID=63057 RepID=A0A2P5BDV9_TREOI|nr:S-locus glycoprotein [Trema orientale]